MGWQRVKHDLVTEQQENGKRKTAIKKRENVLNKTNLHNFANKFESR